MEIKKEYNKNNVMILSVGQEDVDGLLLNWDLQDNGKYQYQEDSFIDTVFDYLPEYALGYDDSPVNRMDITKLLRDSAKSLIKIKRIVEINNYLKNNTPYDQWDSEILKIYNSKGIFSELILHCILREFKGTKPLISKIYFKDSNAVEAHGFDSVHITDNKLWLGETKFYNNGKRGIDALISDLNTHFKHDYLKEQFVIINRAVIRGNEEREQWIDCISKATRLEEKFKIIRIPLLCIYEDKIASDIISTINTGGEYSTLYFEHVSDLKKYFDAKNTFPNSTKTEILLILLPIESKDRIIANMLSKIIHRQNI